MLFVLAARREAPVGLMTVSKSGVPGLPILTSSVIGFLCVIAAYVSPDTVFLFLLNSSGAVILFVYLLIAISQFVLRRRTSPDKLIGQDVAVPRAVDPRGGGHRRRVGQMAFNADARIQLILSLLSWAVFLVLYVATKRLHKEPAAEPVAAAGPSGQAQRILVLANESVEGTELLDELRAIDRAGKAEYFVSSPPTRSTPARRCAKVPYSCGTPP